MNDVPTTVEMRHAKFSPSKLSALAICGKFEYAETVETADDGSTVRKASEAADEGSLLHKALETGKNGGLNEEQQAMVEMVRQYIEATKAGCGGITQELREFKVELKDLTWGYADVVLLVPGGKHAHVLDAKFGRKEVTDAETNFQIETYCAAMFEMLPMLETVTGHIVQPRTMGLSDHTFTRDLLATIRARIEKLYLRLRDPFAPPTPDVELCGMCQWASRCPALGKVVLVTAQGLGLPVPSAFAPESIVAVEDRAFAQALTTALTGWSKQVRENNLEFAKAGGEIPGYDLRTKSTGSRVPMERTLFAADTLEQVGYATRNEVLAHATLSIPKLAEAMTVVRGTTEAEERERIKTALEGTLVEGKATYLQKCGKGKKKPKQIEGV